jgi:Zn-dependent protease with chaperone function
MKIYLNDEGKESGPFSTDELHDKIYSGAVSRVTSARAEQETVWMPLDELLNRSKPPSINERPPVVQISLERLRDPAERTALLWLYIASIPAWLILLVWTIAGLGVPLLIIGAIFAFRAIGEMWFVAYLKTNAVQVSASQLPDLNRVVDSCCKRMGMERPDVYVMQQNVWNAFATKIFGRRMVVLLSGAVDSILLKGDLQQITWVVGHELGHHWAGHLDMKQKLARVGGWLIWVNLWHSRRSEFTCDRVGLYCAASAKSSRLALMNLTVGAQLAGTVNIDEAIKQWRTHSGEFFVKYRTLYSTHPHLLARLEHMNEAVLEFGMAG